MKRIPGLDGLRGAAALTVVIAHYFGEPAHGAAALGVGWLGVGVFFALSGYLIGSIILDGHTRPDFLREFYFRRTIRILPVYLIVVCSALLALHLCQGRPWVMPAFGVPVYLSFTQNIAVVLHGPGNLWLLPTWTLAVEEQFYLVLPLLVMLTPSRWLARVLMLLMVAALLFRLGVYDINKTAALTLLPAKADLLLSGVLAAWLQRRIDLSRHLFTLRVIPLAAICALLAITLIDRDRLFTILNPLLLGVAASAFILALTQGAPEARRFCGPWMAFAGRISYALYLIHQPVNGLLHGLLLGGRPDVGAPSQIGVTGLALVLSVALAHASWRYLETPLLAWSKSLRIGAPTPHWPAGLIPERGG